jgi:hypothetical protein
VAGGALDEAAPHAGRVAHSPLFMLRNAPKMFAHTFRGSTIRSFLGLEHERKTFQRFKAIRHAERAYVERAVPGATRLTLSSKSGPRGLCRRAVLLEIRNGRCWHFSAQSAPTADVSCRRQS